MKRKSILLVVLLIAIGFAAVSTTLIMNGVITITSNKEDFDVYFSEAVLDNVDISDTTISSDKKTINFSTKNLKNVGDTSVLEYEVTNNSTQYDASVQVKCTPNTGDYFILSNSLKETIVAGTSENGKVTVELTKASINEQNINFTCTINVTATERTSVGENIKFNPCEESSKCNAFIDHDSSKSISIGDEITFGSENFYIINNNENFLTLLSKYNLYVGKTCHDNSNKNCSPIVLDIVCQNSDAIGFAQNNAGEFKFPWYGVTAFSSLENKGENYSSYLGSLVEKNVDEYTSYLKENSNLNVISSRLINGEELSSLGCDKNTNSCNKYSFLHETTFWTEDAYDSNSLWVVFSSGHFTVRQYDVDWGHGIRPVIVIPSSELTKY